MKKTRLEIANFTGLGEGIATAAKGWNSLDSSLNFLPAKDEIGGLVKARFWRKDMLTGTGTVTTGQHVWAASGQSASPGKTTRNQPHFDNIEKVYFFVNNLHPTTFSGALAAPTAAANYGGNRLLRVGLYFYDDFYLGKDSDSVQNPLVITVLARRVGAYDANKHAITAAFCKANDTNPIGTCTVGSTNISTSYFTRLTFTIDDTVSLHTLSSGEYTLRITANGTADAGQHLEFGFSDAAGDVFGWAMLDATSTLNQAPAEVIAYRPVSSTTTYKNQAVKVLHGKRAIRRPTGASNYNAAQVEQVTDIHYFTDKHSVFSISGAYFDTYADGRYLKNRWMESALFNTNANNTTDLATGIQSDYHGVNLDFEPKFIGSIDNWVTYQDKLVCAGIGGLSITNPIDLHDPSHSINEAMPVTAIPDIEHRINTVDTAWLAVPKDADVFPPYVASVWTAGINPGRIFAAIGDELIWSGGTTAATMGTSTSWSAFATVQFGDTSGNDKIKRGVFFAGLNLIFTERGHLYYLTGEPPIDPTYGYGTLRADYIGFVGSIGEICDSGIGVLYFTTDDGKTLWQMDRSLVPRKLGTGSVTHFEIESLYWDSSARQLWAYSGPSWWRVKSDWPTSTTINGVQEQEARSLVYDVDVSETVGAPVWFPVRHPILPASDTDISATPTPFASGKTAWQVGCYSLAGTYTYYLKCDVCGDDGIYPHIDETEQLNHPDVASSVFQSCEAYLITKQITAQDIFKRSRQLAQVTGISVEGYLVYRYVAAGTAYNPVTLSAVLPAGDLADLATEETLGTFYGLNGSTGDLTRSVVRHDIYDVAVAPVEPRARFRFKLSTTNPYDERIYSIAIDLRSAGLGVYQ